MSKTNEEIAIIVSRNTIVGNIILFIFKLIAGLVGHSVAMLSDSVHSLSDILSTVIVIIGVKLANKEADQDHPYGHERFESVAAIILSGILLATGFGIGYSGIRTVFAGDYSSLVIPGRIALIAAIVSIIVKEGMYWYMRQAAKQTNSSVLMADAWHHRSDAFSSIGSFVGILGAQIGFPVMDSLASLVISVFIIKVAIDIFRESVSKMTDKAVDNATKKQICNIAIAQDNVLGVDQLKTRMFGDKIYVDIEIIVDRSVPLHVSHDIAHDVHDAIEAEIPSVKHCMVHVNPNRKGQPCESQKKCVDK